MLNGKYIALDAKLMDGDVTIEISHNKEEVMFDCPRTQYQQAINKTKGFTMSVIQTRQVG